MIGHNISRFKIPRGSKSWELCPLTPMDLLRARKSRWSFSSMWVTILGNSLHACLCLERWTRVSRPLERPGSLGWSLLLVVEGEERKKTRILTFKTSQLSGGQFSCIKTFGAYCRIQIFVVWCLCSISTDEANPSSNVPKNDLPFWQK